MVDIDIERITSAINKIKGLINYHNSDSNSHADIRASIVSYSPATSSQNGLMSSADKQKLDEYETIEAIITLPDGTTQKTNVLHIPFPPIPTLELQFTGNKFTINGYGLDGEDIIIDWGDGSSSSYDYENGNTHNYSESGNYLINVTGVTAIKKSCFLGITSLTSVVIPESVTSLGKSCFFNCTNLANIVIPESVTSFGDDCFNPSVPHSYQLYWTNGNIRMFPHSIDSNPPTYYIPKGCTQGYIDKGYYSAYLVERSE